MALLSHSSIFVCKSTPRLAVHPTTNRCAVPRLVRCVASDATASGQTVVRRSANYHPSVWDDEFLQSLGGRSDQILRRETKEERVKELKDQVKDMLETTESSRVGQLELIDTLQRLGVSYHFRDEIDRILKEIFENNKHGSIPRDDLYATSLEFRLLRQHGFNVPQGSIDVFKSFKDDTMDNFNASLAENIEAILSLYEASFTSTKGETVLRDARDFAFKHLRQYVDRNVGDGNQSDEYVRAMVSHALEVPSHWRLKRLDNRWFVDVYRTKPDMNQVLFEFAVLDFNMVQAVHQEDLKSASKWWRKTGFREQLDFARDRLAENFLWSVGLTYEPQFGYFRTALTKIYQLILIIDDIYDVYGTMEELQLFTKAVERWDVNGLDDLPKYMRLCFLVLYNTTNDIGSDILRDKGVNVIPCLQKAWEDMCKVFMVEARWYQSGYKPGLEEYMEVASVSSTAPVILANAYCILTQDIAADTLDLLPQQPIFQLAGRFYRLVNDLGTSSEEIARGDVPKAIQCYMHETGASEEEARHHIWGMVRDTWEQINELKLTQNSLIPDQFLDVAINVARTSLCLYQSGDGIGASDQNTKSWISSLFVHPIGTLQ